jgi:hypothetical protein
LYVGKNTFVVGIVRSKAVEEVNPAIDVIVDISALTGVEELVGVVKELPVVEIDSVRTCVRCNELGIFEKGVEVNVPSDLYNEVPVVEFNNGVADIVDDVVVLEYAVVRVVRCLNEGAGGFELGFSELISIFVESIDAYTAEVTEGVKVNIV